MPADIVPITEKFKKLEKELKKAQESTNKMLSKISEKRKKIKDRKEAKITAEEIKTDETLREAWKVV